MKATISVMLLVFVSYGEVVLSYHDSNPQWLTWGGTYRGTWFDAEDFVPGTTGCLIESAELWFYQSPNHLWDTSQVYVELWNGGAGGPTELLSRVEVTALLQPSATVVYFDPPVETEPDFWCILNTEFSAGGWPSILADGTPSGHSLYSDDGLIWEEFDIGDYFISVCHDDDSSLQRTTWGGVKAVFSN